MMGYCSNSPLRCHHARSLVVLSQVDDHCPHCEMSLVPANNLSGSAHFEQRFLQLSLAITVILLLVLVYLYYAILV